MIFILLIKSNLENHFQKRVWTPDVVFLLTGVFNSAVFTPIKEEVKDYSGLSRPN